jgi:hypothetical protein
VDTWCPQFQYFHTEEDREIYSDAQEAGSHIWWYGCVGPSNPYPTYHIDDNLLSSRIVSWMQKDYNIEGNLYWDASLYLQINKRGRIPVDPYTEPLRFDTGERIANGDGFLLYPGNRYGIARPVPSIRLMSIRDGMEDYEVLSMLEKTIEENRAHFGVTGAELSARTLLNSYYNKLYSGTIANTNADTFERIKYELYQMCEIASSPLKLSFKSIVQDEDNILVSFYADASAAVTLNGEAVTGTATVNNNGKLYQYSGKLDKEQNYLLIGGTVGEQTYTMNKFLSSKFEFINKLESDADVAGKFTFSLTDGSAVLHQSGGDNVAKLTFKGDSGARGYFAYTDAKFGSMDFSKINVLHFSIHSTKAITVQTYLFTTSRDIAFNGPVLQLKSGWNEVLIDTSLMNWKDMGTLKNIRFSMPAVSSETAYTFMVDNIYVNYN